MAIKPTIYKASITLSDIDRHYYNDFNLTIALHPSETPERMMVRILAFALNADENLSFTRGLSSADEPDLWQKSLDDRIMHWIEVGQPEPDRVKKAQGRSEKVSIYLFGKSADTWWQLNQNAVTRFERTRVRQISWDTVQQLMQLLSRTMRLNVTISEGLVYVADDKTSVEVSVAELFN